MASVTEGLGSLQQIKQQIDENAVVGTLLLVDLVASTPYKTQNGEDAWLSRLVDFLEAVKRGLSPLQPTKYLGDAVLGFFKNREIEPCVVLESAKRILEQIDGVNSQRSYVADHKIQVRIVLSYGRVFLFEGNDPQGTAVDKLFRLEKYVPNNCIGLTQEIVDVAKPPKVEPAGRYRLKGLAEGRHELYLLNVSDYRSSESLEQARRRAALYDIWDLGNGKISLISGYIPPDEGQPCTIQMGDKDAVIRAYKNLCLVGRLEEVEELTSLDVREYHLRENVVCIGGPYWNKVSLRFMREIQSPFIFDFSNEIDDRTPIVDCLTEAVYSAGWTGSRLNRDIGFFGRFRNPFNQERHVILVCGIETPAVAGMIRVFSEDQNDFMRLYNSILRLGQIERLHSPQLPDFFALIEFDVEYTGAVHVPAADDQVKNVVFHWSANHNGRMQTPPTN